jgi:hypothetical protein
MRAVRNQDYLEPLPRQFSYGFRKFFSRSGINSGEGFIENQELRRFINALAISTFLISPEDR